MPVSITSVFRQKLFPHDTPIKTHCRDIGLQEKRTDMHLQIMTDQRHKDILPSENAEQLVDFTCATPWERLSLDIELQLRSWNLNDQTCSSTIPTNLSATNSEHQQHQYDSIHPSALVTSRLSFGQSIPLTLQLINIPSEESWNEFSDYAIQRLFGLSTYLLLSPSAEGPVGSSGSSPSLGDTHSECSILLSAISNAITSCKCQIPFFIPVDRKQSLMYIGRQYLNNINYTFTSDLTTQSDSTKHHRHIAGLLKLFHYHQHQHKLRNKLKINVYHINARFKYVWKKFQNIRLPNIPESIISDKIFMNSVLSSNKYNDPISAINIYAEWDKFPVSNIKSNDILAGMPACTSSKLILSLPFKLTNWIYNCMELNGHFLLNNLNILNTLPITVCTKRNYRLYKLSIKNPKHIHNPAAPTPLIDMDQIPRRRRQQHQSTYNNIEEEEEIYRKAVMEEFLIEVGKYLEQTSHVDETIDEEFITSAIAILFVNNNTISTSRGIMSDVMDAIGGNIKNMSMIEKLVRLLAVSESIESAYRLWNLFLDGVEIYWEHGWSLDNIFSDNNYIEINHDFSILIQKLQMINCCIHRLNNNSSDNSNAEKPNMDMDMDMDMDMGRKHMIKGMTLIDNNNEQVWEPYLQEHALVTSDMIEKELQRTLRRQSTSSSSPITSTNRTTKSQSQSLKSDMMSFKAANPKAKLCDFIRWFSPSDWNEQDGLSKRMSRSGNAWEELWNESESIRCKSQITLFDNHAHGSKALCDLRVMTISSILKHCAIIQSEIGIQFLSKHLQCKQPKLKIVEELIPKVKHFITSISTKTKLLRDNMNMNMNDDDGDGDGDGDIDEMIMKLGCIEWLIVVYISLLLKLPPMIEMGNIINELFRSGCVNIYSSNNNNHVMSTLIKMAGLDDDSWTCVLLPKQREFIITEQCDDNKNDKLDRMYAQWGGDQFRVGFRLGVDYI